MDFPCMDNKLTAKLTLNVYVYVYVCAITSRMDFPCMDNELTAKLTLNVPIPAGATLTLTGLTESRTPNGVLTVTSVPSGVMTSGNWSKTSGILVIPILQDIPALTNVTYKFTIINPTAPAKESKLPSARWR